VYDLVKYAPTSMNQQPMRVVLLRSPGARQDLLTQGCSKVLPGECWSWRGDDVGEGRYQQIEGPVVDG
jgi:hypothetical protein